MSLVLRFTVSYLFCNVLDYTYLNYIFFLFFVKLLKHIRLNEQQLFLTDSASTDVLLFYDKI